MKEKREKKTPLKTFLGNFFYWGWLETNELEIYDHH